MMLAQNLDQPYFTNKYGEIYLGETNEFEELLKSHNNEISVATKSRNSSINIGSLLTKQQEEINNYDDKINHLKDTYTEKQLLGMGYTSLQVDSFKNFE